MTRRLVILCSSLKPDPYFNVVCHAALTLGIRRFLLVAIGDNINPERTELAAHIERDLNQLVNELEAGRYWRRDPHDGADHVVTLSRPDAFSEVIEQLGWGALRVEREGRSEDDLAELLAEEARAGSAFDVTACKNSAVAGAVAWLVSRGGSPVYSFELKKPPTFDADDLLPALTPADYGYRDLSASPLVEDALRSVNRFKMQRRTVLLAATIVAAMGIVVALGFGASVALSIFTAVASFASIASLSVFFVDTS